MTFNTIFTLLFSVICVYRVTPTLCDLLTGGFQHNKDEAYVVGGVGGDEWRLVVFSADTGQRRSSSRRGEECFGGTRCGNRPFHRAALSTPTPTSLDCVLRRASGQRSLLFQCHQVVFFALSVLATLSCRTSHAWRLNALSPSSHLENKATANALWPGSAAAAPTKTHILTDVGPNCGTAEKSSTVTISIFQLKTNKNT